MDPTSEIPQQPAKALTVRGATVLGWRRRKDTGSNPSLVAASIAMSAVVLAVFAVDTLRNEPWTFVAILVFGVVSFGLDALTRRHRAEAATSGPQ
jgi:hypothetical protein